MLFPYCVYEVRGSGLWHGVKGLDAPSDVMWQLRGFKLLNLAVSFPKLDVLTIQSLHYKLEHIN